MSARGAAARVTARTTADRAVARSTASAPARPPTTEAPEPARPDLRLVPATSALRTAGRRSAAHDPRRTPFVLLVVALLVGTTLGLLFLNIAIGSDSIRATALRAANVELAQEVERLQREVVDQGTPAALASAATAAGLVPAGSAAYLVIAPDGSSSLRGTVTPAPEAPSRPQPAPPRSARSADRD